MGSCLVVEDDPGQQLLLCATLKTAGHLATAVGSGGRAVGAVREASPDVILLDLGLPDIDGVELIPQLLAADPLGRIIVISGENSAATAVGALRAGARRYLVKPWDREELLLAVEREVIDAHEDRVRARRDAEAVYWGVASRIEAVRRKLTSIARSPLTPVLITGERGAGKTVVARELHRLTGSSGPFVSVDCAAMPDERLEGELFGDERGNNSGTRERLRGAAELADEGTLYLDEIGGMGRSLQAKLLQFLQDHRFSRLGGEDVISSRCRVVAAASRGLETMMDAASSHGALHHRLAEVTLEVPPLRERPEDIVPLARHIGRVLAAEIGLPPRQLSPAAERALIRHAWPGNVRELRNRLERALILGTGETIRPADLDLPDENAWPAGRPGDG